MPNTMTMPARLQHTPPILCMRSILPALDSSASTAGLSCPSPKGNDWLPASSVAFCWVSNRPCSLLQLDDERSIAYPQNAENRHINHPSQQPALLFFLIGHFPFHGHSESFLFPRYIINEHISYKTLKNIPDIGLCASGCLEACSRMARLPRSHVFCQLRSSRWGVDAMSSFHLLRCYCCPQGPQISCSTRPRYSVPVSRPVTRSGFGLWHAVIPRMSRCSGGKNTLMAAPRMAVMILFWKKGSVETRWSIRNDQQQRSQMIFIQKGPMLNEVLGICRHRSIARNIFSSSRRKENETIHLHKNKTIFNNRSYKFSVPHSSVTLPFFSNSSRMGTWTNNF